MSHQERLGWQQDTSKLESQSVTTPRDFSKSHKYFVTINISLLVFCVNFAASSIAPAIENISQHLDTSRETTTLSISLFVLGFALGPLVWAPLSEHVGRRPPLFAGVLIYIALQVPIACTKHISIFIVCRLLAGIFGSAAISIPPGQATDVFAPEDRGPAVALYLLMVFLGPLVGPVAGVHLLLQHAWQWIVWTGMIMTAATLVLCLFTVRETSARVLRLKNNNVTTSDGTDLNRFDEKILAQVTAEPCGARQQSRWKAALHCFYRPFHLAQTEPILLILTLHTSLVYAVIYISFFAVPYCFKIKRQWHPTEAYLSLLAMGVGILLGFIILTLYNTFWGPKQLTTRNLAEQEQGQKLAISEIQSSKLQLHLPMLGLGSLMLPLGFFWFTCAIQSGVHWILPMSAVMVVGAAIMLVYTAGLSFLVDIYSIGDRTNSALAVAACGRALLSASFPLFVLQMYEKLGVTWAGSLLGFVCCPLGLIPLFLWWRLSRGGEA